jgi:hypothetical protein
MGLTNTPSDLLPGTLELLILKAISHGTKHGYGIVEHLRAGSGDVLQVGESALYPALQRLLVNGWVKAEWGTSGSSPGNSQCRGRRRRDHARKISSRFGESITSRSFWPWPCSMRSAMRWLSMAESVRWTARRD